MFFRSFAFSLVVILSSLSLSCVQPTTGNGLFNGAVSGIQLSSTDDLYRFLTYDEKRYPLVSAHRGGPTDGYPENALETFRFRAEQQALIIEFDIRMTRDSVLILMHDETLDRTTNGSGKVSDKSFDEIRSLQLKDPKGVLTSYKIPTLDEALEWGRGKVVFTLDVKRGVPYARVVDAVHRKRAESYSVIITYSADEAALVHGLDPQLMISASIRMAGDLLRLNDRNIPDNRLVAFVGTSEVDRGVYELLHGHGIMCILGTMGNLDAQAQAKGADVYKGLVERGADIISTDNPELAGEALRTYRKETGVSSSFIK